MGEPFQPARLEWGGKNKGNVKLTNRSCRRGTQNPNPIVDGSNNLTSAQKYTSQQIIVAQRNIFQSRYFAPTDTDVLLRFPVAKITLRP